MRRRRDSIQDDARQLLTGMMRRQPADECGSRRTTTRFARSPSRITLASLAGGRQKKSDQYCTDSPLACVLASTSPGAPYPQYPQRPVGLGRDCSGRGFAVRPGAVEVLDLERKGIPQAAGSAPLQRRALRPGSKAHAVRSAAMSACPGKPKAAQNGRLHYSTSCIARNYFLPCSSV
jgi:hypothetical protein